MKINIAEKIAPCFDDAFFDIHEHNHTHYWLKGGRGSTKSSFISTQIPLLLINNPMCHAVVLRKVGNTLRNSVYNQIQWGISHVGLTNKFKFITSPLEITYKKTGQKILFFGVDDKTKIKSIKLPFGYVGIIWYEELDQFTGMEEIRSLNQSLMRGGKKFWCFSSFNPPKSRDNWVNGEQLIDDIDRYISHTTYLQVPRGWLGEQFYLEADKLKNTREKLYKHEYLGEVTGTGGSVFDNIEEREITDEEISQFDRRKHGIDFGFAVDPLAFLCGHYDKKHEILYLFDEIYQQKLSNKRAYELIKDKVERRRITADSAEPKSIAELRGYGLNIYGARKGPDSVEYGMKWLQSLSKIVIDKKRCPNTYKEFVNYEYAKNKDGDFISEYPDKNNHAIDACRYMCEDEMKHSGIGVLK
ncbi:PBSX family phage terminase large subunit [Anaerosinus sp.]